MLVTALCALVLILLVTSAVLTTIGSRQQRAHYEALLAVERDRVSDLLNRLAARNLPEYQAYVPDLNPPEAKDFMFDDFGLLTEERA